MKLLFTLTSYPPAIGGAQLLQHQLALELRNEHRIQVITQWDTNRTDWLLGTTLLAPRESIDYTMDGIPVHRLGLSWRDIVRIAPSVATYYAMMPIALPSIAAPLEQAILPYAAGTDLVHNARIGREGLSYASYRAAQQLGIPFVFTPLHHPRWTGWRYRAFTDLYRRADLLFALTNVEQKTLVELGVASDRITVIGMGPILASRADPVSFLEAHHIEGPMVLFIGQHYLYKGYRQLLQAAPIIWKAVPDAHFVFIGPSVGNSERYFRKFADRRIHRLGPVDLEEKTNALAACTMLCVPSTQESFGGVYLEAWNFGKPVVGCRIPAVSEVIADGIDGRLTEQEPYKIAGIVSDLLLEPDRARVMGNAGKLKAQEKYSWQKVAERTNGAYKIVLGL